MVLNAGGGRAARTYLTAREKPWEGSEGCEEGDGGEVAGLAAALAPLAVDAAVRALGQICEYQEEQLGADSAGAWKLWFKNIPEKEEEEEE